VHLGLKLLRENRDILPVSDGGERVRYRPAYCECEYETSILQRHDNYHR
jgi:hypothetical protein